jgi:hypothetical protein
MYKSVENRYPIRSFIVETAMVPHGNLLGMNKDML